MIKCPVCGKSVELTSKGKIKRHKGLLGGFLASKCLGSLRKLECSHYTEQVKQKECELCGAVFVPKNGKQVYCSDLCFDLHTTTIRVKRRRFGYGVQIELWEGCEEHRQEYHKKKRARGVFLIFERDGFKCIYCGRTSIEDGVTLHADHIIPKSKGGGSVAGNLVTACKKCNLTKKGRLLIDQDRVLKEVAKRNQQCGIHDLLTITI